MVRDSCGRESTGSGRESAGTEMERRVPTDSTRRLTIEFMAESAVSAKPDRKEESAVPTDSTSGKRQLIILVTAGEATKREAAGEACQQRSGVSGKSDRERSEQRSHGCSTRLKFAVRPPTSRPS
jgi:hypothetical protein